MVPVELHARASLVGCTIAAHNYLPLARVLARSFLQHHQGARFVVAFIDYPLATRALTDECFEVVPITEIDFGEAGFEHMAAAYDVTEFATSVKPFLLRHLLKEAECVLYLDPDICVYAPLDSLVEATLNAGWSLTPHCVHPITRDGTYPREADIMAAGVYNLGYTGVTERAAPFLDWWSERLRQHSLIDPSNHLFTDQRWIDLALPIFSPYIERSPAYNVAYWNVDQRPLRREGDVVMVGDEPLRFFHFSGYDRTAPWWLSKYQPTKSRVLLSEHPCVAELCIAHTEAVTAAGGGVTEVLYGWADAFPGMPLDRPLRRLYHKELVAAVRSGTQWPPTPFIPDGADKFRRWLSEPNPEGGSGLPRYLDALWAGRVDLRQAFPEVAAGQTDGFWQWVRQSGRYESEPLALLGLSERTSALPAAISDVGRERGGLDVVGYFSAELGIGEAGRLLTAALAAACIPVSSISCNAGSLSRQAHPFRTQNRACHDTVLLAVNADQFGEVRHQLGDAFFADRYVIGQWFWEVQSFPERFVGSFHMLNEIWVATEHIQRSVAAWSSQQPVVLMPLPLVAPSLAAGVGKADFGLDARFTFLFSFDFLSVFERKNPLGVINAFRDAFGNGEGPVLMIKTINGQHRQQDLERLRWAARGRSDIVVFDGYLDPGMMGALTASCDCYVSLHRAEGLGLTMSEAMALGKPVIATAYSGNMDFMTPETAYLVPWHLSRIGDSAPPYPSEGMWAEPDIAVASRLMRGVMDDPGAAALVGEGARDDLALRFSPVETGIRIRQRLEAIWGARYA